MNSVRTIISSIAVLALILSVDAYSQDTREVRKTVDLNTDGQLYIDTYKGSVKIETWEKPQVEIYALIEPDGYGRDERKKVDDTEIRIHSSPNRVEIRTDYDNIRDHRSWFFGLFGDNSGSLPFVHYTIKMPSAARLKIKDYKSDTKITNLNAALKMETYKGTVDILGATAGIDLETYKGEVKIDFTNLKDDCRFETYKGRIDLDIPKDAGFKIDADMGRRADLNCDFDLNIKRKSKHNESFMANINNGGPALRISSEKGEVRILEK